MSDDFASANTTLPQCKDAQGSEGPTSPIVKRQRSMSWTARSDQRSDRSAGQNILLPPMQDCKLRDSPGAPALVKNAEPRSASRNSRKRSATSADDTALQRTPDRPGFHKRSNSSNANGGKRKERRATLTARSPQNKRDQADRGANELSFHALPDGSSLHPGNGSQRMDSDPQEDPTFGPASPTQVNPAIKMPPDASHSRELTSAVAIAATASTQNQTNTKSPSPTNGASRRYNMLLQPDVRSISESQLVNEVRGIYAGLVMVERKCIDIVQQQANSKTKLSPGQWQALIALHRTLLHEHHDFFLASQHPAASPPLQNLATKYAMPARMWRHGIHSFLELLRHRLPEAIEHMSTYVYTAYSMMALLVESVPNFQDTWIERLGDLSRYRMAIEESGPHDRETWAGVARYWYNKAADKSPNVGRIQHHFAVLSRPDILQQVFYYTKSMVCVQPFQNAWESVHLVFDPILRPVDSGKELLQPQQPPVIVTFVRVHGDLFSQQSISCIQPGDKFVSLLGSHIGHVTLKWREQGAYIASINCAAMLEYGKEDGLLMPFFLHAIQQRLDQDKSAATGTGTPSGASLPQQDSTAENKTNPHLENFKYAMYFAFHVLSFVLRHIGNKNVVPHVHVSLAFLWSLISVPPAISYVEAEVPWQKIVTFLNSLKSRHTISDISGLEGKLFPASSYESGVPRQLPEDFVMRGQIWSRFYYLSGFFNQLSSDNDERTLECPSVALARADRCLWLGNRIASMNKWIRLDGEENTFQMTEYALQLEKYCNHPNVFAPVYRKRPNVSYESNVRIVDPESHGTAPG